MKKKTVWFGEIEELGGEQYVVVAETEQDAKDALLYKWREYDRGAARITTVASRRPTTCRKSMAPM
jgi:hypothetical protein